MRIKKSHMRIVLFIYLALFALPATASDYVEGEILVRFKKGISNNIIDNTLASFNMTVSSVIGSSGVYRIALPEGQTVPQVIEKLKKDNNILYAEPNYIYYAFNRPDDPMLGEQWYIENTGQTLSCNTNNECFPVSKDNTKSPTGTKGSDINALTGWDTQIGKSSVTIAILDTGIDLDHPDLKNKIVSGYNFVDNNTNTNDDYGHGTHVAGIAAAETNNGIGIAGVCWNCKIMPVKVLDSTGAGTAADVASGIDFARNNGAKVINLSLGGDFASSVIADALKAAYGKNIISVCAAGNSGAGVSFPAAHDDYCIAVAATTNKDINPYFSNFGDEIDVAAPGVDIYSTHIVGGGPITSSTCKETSANSGYGFCSGTSMAAPVVAGIAALIVSQHPEYKPDEVLFSMMQNANDVNSSTLSGFDAHMGAGRVTVNAGKITATSVEVDDNSGTCFVSLIGGNNL